MLVRLIPALVLATVTNCGSLPVASGPPTVSLEPGAATTAPAPTPGVIRVRWMYLPERRVLVLQEDGHTGVMKAARLRDPNGTILASAATHRATSGEPRACGHPDIVPPFVVTLAVGPDVADALRGPDSRHFLEVQEEKVDWYETELLDWTILASPPCFTE